MQDQLQDNQQKPEVKFEADAGGTGGVCVEEYEQVGPSLSGWKTPKSGSSSSNLQKSVASRLKTMLDDQKQDVKQNYENGSSSCCKLESINLNPVQRQIVRLIGQHLNDLGMKKTVETLIEECGFPLENAEATQLRRHVLNGDWANVQRDLDMLTHFLEEKVGQRTKMGHNTTTTNNNNNNVVNNNDNDSGTNSPSSSNNNNNNNNNNVGHDLPKSIIGMRFLVLQQKYLEFLEKGKLIEAVDVLRSELTPLQYDTDRVHLLSTCMMINNSDDLKKTAHWDGSTFEARSSLLNRLQEFLPPSVMLPPKRLDILLDHALEWQRQNCILHNIQSPVVLDEDSIFVDHLCDNSNFPTEVRQTLSEHCDEVWFLQFSHSGRYLASASKDNRVIVWRQDAQTRQFVKKATLEGHSSGAAFLAWSPDDKFLLVVGPDENGPDCWVWDMHKFELHTKIQHHHDDNLSACAWFPDSKRFVCGGTKGQFYVSDVDGQILDSWEGIRIRCLACKKDGHTVLASDTQNRIRSYAFDKMEDKTLFKEEHPLMFFTLSEDERHLLCNVGGQGVHLWNLDTKTVVKRFRGSANGYVAVFSCFGGVGQQFVASGSEDSNIYIWNINDEHPVAMLKSHVNVVNGVSWNPKDPTMLASCSDDGTVKIWGPPGCQSSTVRPVKTSITQQQKG